MNPIRIFRSSITTKVISVNLLILLAVGGIVVMNLLVSRQVGETLIAVIDQDVAQVIKNAELSRDLNKVFADTHLLLDTFTERRDILKTEGTRLVTTLQTSIAAIHEGEEGSAVLTRFTQSLEALLDQCEVIIQVSQRIQTMENELDIGLITVEGMILQLIRRWEERDAYLVSPLEKVRTAMPGYSKRLLQVHIWLAESKQAYLGTATVEDAYDQQILTVLEELHTGFTAVATADKELAVLGEQLVETVQRYQEQIPVFHQALREFQTRLRNLNSVQTEAMSVMQTIDAEVAQATGRVRETVAGNIRSSGNATLALSGIVLGVLVLVGVYAVKMIRPLVDLARTAARLTTGDITCTVREPRTHDEIGILSRAFKHLISYFQEMASAATEIAQGNLSQTIRPRSEHDVLGQALNQMIRRLNEIFQETDTLIQAVQDGNLDIRGNTEVFEGGWRDLVMGINHVIEAFMEPLNVTAESLERISRGDIPGQITETYQGDFNTIKQNLNVLIGNLNTILQELSILIQAVQAGKLTSRGNADQFIGEWRKLVVGINNVIEAFVTPITTSAATIDRIAKGEIPDHITEDYQGDFNTIKQNLNTLIDASKEVTRVAQEMAAGNLLVKVQERSDQDTLMQALNTMIQNLKGVVKHVKTAATEVEVGSQQMSESAEMMTQGVSQQAASAEEVSSSMEEMAANIKQNADNARQTEKIAIQSAQYAEESSKVVAETVLAMQQIAKKISIIQEIADQTRMLSLNATIEAARAQEYGKAFSVVAAEVRTLSDVTKRAAEEINELASSSVGVAENAGKMLAELVPNIHKTAELVQEISAASGEQSSGAEQVNMAVQQLDQVTQQNASTADEVATATEELMVQARQLQRLMAFFRSDETSLESPEEQEEAARLAHLSASTPEVADTPPHHKIERDTGKEQEIPPKLVIDMEEREGEGDDLDAEFERY